jgi:uncharacterized protein (TIGR02001 family)
MKRPWIPLHAGAISIALCAMSPIACAETAVNTTTGSVSVVNDYLFRGLSQTNRDPALQGGIEFDQASGWYVGGWGSNISWLSDTSTSAAPVSSSLEVDLYTGWRGHFSSDWTYDAGLYEYDYPGSYARGYTRPYTLEGYAALGWKSVTLKYSESFGNLFGFAGSRHSSYLDLSWNWEFVPGWVLNTHAGHQQVAQHPGYGYSDWKVGVTRNLAHGWSLALGYYDTDARRSLYTNADGHDVGRATGVLSVARAF